MLLTAGMGITFWINNYLASYGAFYSTAYGRLSDLQTLKNKGVIKMENENETNETETQVDETTVETPVTKEKLFKQADVDKVVRERVAREKAALKAAQDAWETEKSELKANNEHYEKLLSESIKEQIATIPEVYRSLVEKLSLSEKIEWLNSNNGTSLGVEKKTIPQTPKASVEKKEFKPTKTGRLF